MTTRRTFLKAVVGAPAVVSFGAAAPNFLLRAAEDAEARRGETVLVVVQLGGGNDGLNTVIPYVDDAYHRNRFTLRIAPQQIRKIDEHLGFHPSLAGFSKLLEDGHLAIIQGVGYPNPNRSHFESMDIWNTARTDAAAAAHKAVGWVGRALDRNIAGNRDAAAGVAAIHVGREKQPLALRADRLHSPSIPSPEAFRLAGSDDVPWRKSVGRAAEAQRAPGNDLLQFVQSSTTAALAASDRIRRAIGRYKTDVHYPATPLAEKLKNVAQWIDADLATRVYYLTHDGFDTHSEQAAAHAALLDQLGAAVSSFIADVGAHGHGKRVALLCFSEFGRRVRENASGGTDHGAAAPMFLAGARVRPGLVGRHPSLTDLVDGDLKFHTDFRCVYAAMLDRWLGWKSAPILGAAYKPLDLFTA